MEISVLIPVYNVEQYIDKCINSLLRNTFINKCELIFVNDGSTDNSIQVLKSILDSYFSDNSNSSITYKILSNDKNMGIAYTRNRLLSEAKGKYILFVDPDDWTEPDYIELLYNKAEETDAEVTGCKLVKINPDGRTFPYKCDLPENPHDAILSYTQNKTPSWLPIKMFKNQTIKENNLIFQDGISLGEDAIFFVKFLTCCKKTAFVDKVLYYYFQRPKSITNSLIDLQHANSIVISQNLITDYLMSYDKELANQMIYSKILKKYWLIVRGSYKTQKKYSSLWPEIDNGLKIYYKDRKINQIILSSKHTLLSAAIIKIIVLKKLLKKKYSLKDYLTK